MKKLKKIVEGYNKIEEYILAALLLAATVICCYEVVMRYVFIRPTKWSEEYIRYMMVWMVFIGISVASKEPRSLINFDLLYSKFSERWRLIMDIVIYALIFLFCTIIGVVCIRWEAHMVTFGGVSTAMRIPKWIPRIIMPVSFLLLTFRFFACLIAKIRGFISYCKRMQG